MNGIYRSGDGDDAEDDDDDDGDDEGEEEEKEEGEEGEEDDDDVDDDDYDDDFLLWLMMMMMMMMMTWDDDDCGNVTNHVSHLLAKLHRGTHQCVFQRSNWRAICPTCSAYGSRARTNQCCCVK